MSKVLEERPRVFGYALLPLGWRTVLCDGSGWGLWHDLGTMQKQVQFLNQYTWRVAGHNLVNVSHILFYFVKVFCIFENEINNLAWSGPRPSYYYV